jgi:hypothetical protein
MCTGYHTSLAAGAPQVAETGRRGWIPGAADPVAEGDWECGRTGARREWVRGAVMPQKLSNSCQM